MSLISKNYFNCVAALGYQYFDHEAGENKYQWFGTSILWGEKGTDGKYNVYLVTNKHVLQTPSLTPNIIVRFSPSQSQSANNFILTVKNIQGQPMWIEHPNKDVDIAIIPLNGQLLGMQESLNYFTRENSYLKQDLINTDVFEGDVCYLLGYPLNIIDMYNLIYPVVRRGAVSEIHSYYNGYNQCYLIDINNFPGNSGGPVLLESERSEGKKVDLSKFIGVVKSYIYYRETAASLQTGRHRVIFEENSGLAWVEPVEHIIETVNHYNSIQLSNALQHNSLVGLS